ncbi:hypothetical protein DM02DRAFT_388581 [Periconia macrospinosa]|uniref:Uncharacterized protein n=1 Tax=Periconia macrospinosa TaxID=97972 RepID=A0A2V1DQW1_9PLEO|nr:hypothetical protein DM02DRAFT_388581 [Periconia macrospinosa]
MTKSSSLVYMAVSAFPLPLSTTPIKSWLWSVQFSPSSPLTRISRVCTANRRLSTLTDALVPMLGCVLSITSTPYEA